MPPLARRREGVARPEVRQRRHAFAKGPVSRRRLCTGMAPRNLLRSLGSGTVLESPACVAGLDNVAVVRQPIEHGGCHFGVAEHLRPIRESEIGGDQQRRVLVELADQVEQQLTARLAERQINDWAIPFFTGP